MNSIQKTVVLLVADDNPDDRLLIEAAWEETALVKIYFVEDGEELMDFLCRQGKYSNSTLAPSPDLILLDLRMPRKNGHEVLRELKTHPTFRRIPIVVLTTSKAELDIVRSYDLGANSYFTKPDTFDEILDLTQTLNDYWFERVNLPSNSPADNDT